MEREPVKRLNPIGGVITGLLGAAFVCFLWMASAAYAPASAADTDYVLGPGDEIRVTVYGHEDLSGEFQVDGTGHVSLPLIRTVEAAGLTVAALEQVITDRLSPEYLKNPSVSVDVLNYRPFYIIGEVKEPGSYAFVSGMTVWNAVAMAGGFTYRARKSRVEIRRGGEGSSWQDAKPDTPVMPGDVIKVPERFF
jgi:polysaccharide export outer membrane protein